MIKLSLVSSWQAYHYYIAFEFAILSIQGENEHSWGLKTGSDLLQIFLCIWHESCDSYDMTHVTWIIWDWRHMFSLGTFCIKFRYFVNRWPPENFCKCSFSFIFERHDYSSIIIMRNKILILLFASACANFLDLVLPKTCPWV